MMVQAAIVYSEMCEKFSYPAYAKNMWQIYSVLSMVVIAPLPLYGYIFFDKDYNAKIILIFFGLGLFLAVVYRNLNQKYNHLYRDVYLCEDGMVLSGGKDNGEVKWNEIVDVKEFGRGSKYNLKSAGDEGIVVTNKHGQEFVIFSSINNYELLRNLIKDKLR